MEGDELGMAHKLIILFTVLGVALIIDNYRLHGRLVEWADINNHETIAIALLAFALGLAL